jgi:arylsulfatase A-like enzyme
MKKPTAMSRRTFMSRVLCVNLASWTLPQILRSETTPTQRPNIVFFILDDMHRHMFNCLPEGKGKNLTPTIDRLAAEGMVMLGQHVASPVCTPSRYNCLTGRYASRTLADAKNPSQQTVVTWNTHILPHDITLATRLRKAGYATGFVGKNHVVKVPGWTKVGWDADPTAPQIKRQLKENAERSRSTLSTVGFDFAERIYHNNPDGNGSRHLAVHNLDWIAEGALKFIDHNRDKPFFLYVASTIPHGPTARERSWQADPRITADGILETPPQGLPARDSLPRRLKTAHIGTPGRENLLWLDDAVGAVMARLEKHGLDKNTMVFFFNDHGQAAKGTLYQSGVSNPSIIWKKGGFPGGSTSDALVSNVDFAPTILDLAGVTHAKTDFDGQSFYPVLEGRTRSFRTSLYFELGYARGVRKGPWKYLALRYPKSVESMSIETRRKNLERVNRNLKRRGRPIITEDPTAPFSHLSLIPGGGDAERSSTGQYPAYYDVDQLYNLLEDPTEQTNLAYEQEYASVLQDMKQTLRRYLDALPGPYAELKPDTKS